ncbi:MAG: phosphatidylserine decarboxylase, partial [Planktomarina sp.]|nr:phosphatidylserine decarboxylase [Planktomarina sp.]
KASEHNERNAITIEATNSVRIGVIQIAGLVARRIVCFTKTESKLNVGDRFGLIRFGSRLDVFLPEGVEPSVGLGQTAVAGETVIANLNEEKPQRLIERI